MKLRLLLSFVVLLVLSSAAIPVMAQSPEPDDGAYRLQVSAIAGQLSEGTHFAATVGFERAVVGSFTAGTEFRQVFGSESRSSLAATARYYFRRGTRVEPFALGRYDSQINNPDVAAFGGGANFFIFPKNPNLGLRVEVTDDVLEGGEQSAAVRAGVVFRF